LINQHKTLEGNDSVVFVYDSSKKKYKVFVDTEDLAKIISTFSELRIYIQDKKPIVNCVFREKGKKMVRLHRFLADADSSQDVKLLDGDTLNLRKKNLIKIKKGQGALNVRPLPEPEPVMLDLEEEMLEFLKEIPSPQEDLLPDLEADFDLLTSTLVIKKGSTSLALKEREVSNLKLALSKLNI
jgi:hypothetical protein